MKSTTADHESHKKSTNAKKRRNLVSDNDGQKLLENFLAGEERAFDLIIKAYSPMMFGVFLRWFKLSVDDAQDLHQEVLLQLVLKAGSIRNLRPWLLGTAINQAKKRIRKLMSDRKLSEVFIHDFELMKPADDHEARDLVERGLNLASQHDRELLHLIFFEDLTYQETADQLGLSIGSIGPMRGRALDHFSTIIEHLEAPGAAISVIL